MENNPGLSLERQPIATEKACKPIGPYSQAVAHNGIVYCSGQIGLNSSGELASSLRDQTLQVFKNIAAVLEAAGSGRDSILRCAIYLIDMEDFAEVNGLYEEFIEAPHPARSTIEVKRLPRDARIEIEVTAIQKRKP